MKTQALCLFLSIALCASRAFAASHTEVTKAPRLQFLRGMNFRGYYESVTDAYADKPSTYSTLKSKGFDHVRLPVDLRQRVNYSNGTATFKSNMSTIDTAIDCAEAAGLYIILDFHGWFQIDPADAASTNQFIAIWKATAERYQDRSNKLIFELANEPRTKSYGTLCTMQKNAIKEIRKTNPTRLILFDPGDASQPWVLTGGSNFSWVSLPANDNNIAVVIHCYNPGEFTHQGAWGHSSTQVRLTDSHRTTLNWDLSQCKAWLDGTGVPIVMDEFGAAHSVAVHDDVTEYDSIVTRWCEANGVPWAPWLYCQNSEFDCFNSNGTMIDYVEAGLFPDLKTTDKFSASDYAHSVEVTFSGYAGSGALADFPALVKLSERLNGFHYADFQKPNGFDLCFTDAGGNLLAHEIDTWDTNGVSAVWVKVPSLTASTKIVARYGCAKPIVPKVESVWDSDYVGVWHMGESALPLADSTGVSRDVTSADGTGIGYGAAGIVGGSVDFGATGAGRGVNADDHMNLDGFQKMTIEAWTFQTSRPASGDKNTGILGKRSGANSQASYYLYDNGNAQKTSFYVSSSGTSAQGAGNLVPTALNVWNHQVHTFDGSSSSQNASGYLNGVLQGSGTVDASQIFAGSAELHIGSFQSGDTRNFPGRIDEVRISKTVRSADWIQATHDTVAKANFATYAVDGAAPTVAPRTFPFKRGTNCRGLDEKPYSTSPWNNSTYIYGLDNTFPDIKARGFDFVRFSVDLTKYYDSANDALFTSGSYSIATIDTIMQKMLDAGLYVHLLMGRVDGGDLDLSNSEQKTRFKKVWQRVAERYRNWSDHIAFELCNEPKANTGGTISQLNALFAETVEVIRQTNPTRLILWPVADGSQPWILTASNGSLVQLPADHSNIALVVHVYNPADFTHQGASWTTDSSGNPRNYHVDLTDAHRNTLRWDLNQIKSYTDAHPDVPVIMNEFGVMLGLSTPADATEYMSTVREFCETNGIPWAHFEYVDFNNNAGMASRNGPTGAWRPTVIDALFPDAGEPPDPPPPDSGIALSGAAAAPGFSWTNATATVTASAADVSAVPAGAKVRLTVADDAGTVIGTVDRDWTGAGDYAFDTAGAIGGAAFADGFDYTFTFSVVDAGGNALVEDTAAAALRLGASAPWFSADAATVTVAGGSWETAPTVESGAYVIESDAAFSADEGRAGYARVEFALSGDVIVSPADLPELLAFATEHGERASLVAVLGDGGAIVWHGLVQENGAPAWRALEGADDSSDSVQAVFELDTTDAEPRVSYFVWDAGAEPPSFVRLHDANGAEWFPAPGSGATMAGRLDFQGDGAVSGFVGQVLDKAVAEANGVRYDSLAEALASGDVTLLTNAEWPADAPAGTIDVDPDGHTLLRGGVAVEGGSVVVDSGPVVLAGEGTLRVTFANLANVGVATAGLSPAELAEALAEDGANGIPKWQSYVLGLDTEDRDALPRADIALGDAGVVAVSAHGLAVDETAGATVTYRVYEIPDITHPDADAAVGAPAAPGTPVELPMGDAASRFFRVKVGITLP